MNFEVVIGLEIHAQLAAQSKIFSAASVAYCEDPNTQVREVDAGLPGALPVLNQAAVECAARLGYALSATINKRCEFARKNYFYPDLPKGYQISQFEYPIVSGGELWIDGERGRTRIGITRAHLEEDAGKLVHEGWAAASAVDLNRAGVPLLEIVSEPELFSIADAVRYAMEMHRLVRWLEICDGNMQEGSFRMDANLSLRRPGDGLGTRCEIKNLNSFRFLQQALAFEAERQAEILTAGGTIVQETRLFDTAKGETRSMRGKEDAHDYRYFPDPDLPPLVLDDAYLAAVRDNMPALPWQKRQTLMDEFSLSAYDADILTADKGLSDYFDAVWAAFSADLDAQTGAQTGGDAKLCANWLCGDFSALLNEHKLGAREAKITPENFAGLMRALRAGEISGKMGKDILAKMWADGGTAAAIIVAEGLSQINDAAALEKIAAELIAAHPEQVAAYRAGKEKLIGFFVGQMMKKTKGQANPAQANAIFKKMLAE